LVSQAGTEARLRRRLEDWGGMVARIGFPGVPLVERFLLADVHADLPLPRDAVSVWWEQRTGYDALGVQSAEWTYLPDSPPAC
jgi:4,5-epoxidase